MGDIYLLMIIVKNNGTLLSCRHKHDVDISAMHCSRNKRHIDTYIDMFLSPDDVDILVLDCNELFFF